MPGRIHIIDRDAGRRAALRDALTAAYFTVTENGDEGTGPQSPPPVLAFVDADAEAAEAPPGVPVILTATQGAPGARALLSRLGRDADDVLLHPFDARVAAARARNLIRLKIMRDELALREATARDLGFGAAAEPPPDGGTGAGALVLLIAPKGAAADALASRLEAETGARCDLAEPGFAALRAVETLRPDAVVVADGVARLTPATLRAGFAEAEDAIGVIAAVRARAEARHAVLLHLSDPQGARAGRIAAALDAGATDCAAFADDAAELVARLTAQLARKRQTDGLRAALDEGVRRTATDHLTGLFGRRYFETHSVSMVERALREGAPLALMMFDIDHFKQVNDCHGHHVGDQVLAAFATRLRACVRSPDLVARYGGEEFVAIMPNATEARAVAAAERVRRMAAASPVETGAGAQIRVTVSAGVAGLRPDDGGPDALLRRADAALREAKRAGRDRVRLTAA